MNNLLLDPPNLTGGWGEGAPSPELVLTLGLMFWTILTAGSCVMAVALYRAKRDR